MEPGTRGGGRDRLLDLPDESPRPRTTSLFTVIDHRRSAPLVFPPAPPRPQQPDSLSGRLKKRLKKDVSLTVVGGLVIYAVVLWMTLSIGIARSDAQRAHSAEAEVAQSSPSQ